MSLPFHVHVTAGAPAYKQVLEAVHRALANGQLEPGSAFPSVRELSKGARINPNTAHKVVQHLVSDGVLEVLPGRGTRVCERRELDPAERLRVLSEFADRLVVEARRHGLGREDIDAAISAAWRGEKD